MREGLARELPEAGRAFTWARSHFVFYREPAIWAAVSAIGSGFLVAAVLGSLVGLAYRALTAANPQLELPPFITVAGAATSAAMALAIGGPIALVLDFAYVGFGIALRIPGLMTFCERNSGALIPPPLEVPDACTPVGFVSSLWPLLIGIGLGVALARTPAVRENGINSLLRVAGALAIALTLLGAVWGATLASTASPTTSGLTLAAS